MGANKMDKVDEQILRAAKEIVVKFIETGRVSRRPFPRRSGPSISRWRKWSRDTATKVRRRGKAAGAEQPANFPVRAVLVVFISLI